MTTVANQRMPSGNNANTNNMNYGHQPNDAPPMNNIPAPAKGKTPVKSGKGANQQSKAPVDVNQALLAKISQLEATTAESAKDEGEIEAEVKKANRDMTQFLNTVESHNSKLDVLQRKYSELLGEMKRVEREHMKAKKRGDQLQKEKEEVGKTLTKEKALKEKLEKLSRELTKENKRLKDDLRDEKETGSDRNEELHRRLEGLVDEVYSLSNDRAPEQQTAAIEYDKLFREKFTSFLHQYELRELHFQSVLRMKDMEVAYQIARHDNLKKAQESELSKSHQLTRQVSTFSQTENELRGQLNVYVEKFKQQVEDTLNNSNDLFLTFRKEMEEMSKKTKRLEKENLNLTRKQEATNKSIFQMAEERSQNQQSIERLARENDQLKKLCRAMQSGNYNTGAVGDAGTADGDFDETLEGETESEYDEEYDEDEEEAEYEDDTEEEGIDLRQSNATTAKTFGPVPPPAQQNQNHTGGKGQIPNGTVNGVRHAAKG